MRPALPGATGSPVFIGDRADIIDISRLRPRVDRSPPGVGPRHVATILAFPQPVPVVAGPAPRPDFWDRLRALIDRLEQRQAEARARARDRAVRRAAQRPVPPPLPYHL